MSELTKLGDQSDAVPRSIGRVLDLLEIVLEAGGCNLASAAAAAELTPTTALRHLRALEARGYLERDGSGVFSAGPTLLRISATLHEAGPLGRLVTVAQPHLDALALATGESSYLVVLDGKVATYVACAESSRAIRHVGWVGQNVPLEGSAAGEAFANAGATAVRTGAVEADITAMSLALSDAGALGVAVSVVGPSHRFTTPATTEIEHELVGAVHAIAQDLGLTTEEAAS
jgi:DNA-binding IclR family transcriptional regulator